MTRKIRILHHLPRTGGTLISKCLASLPGTALLSEVNPRAPEEFVVLDPMFQASFWLRLLNESSARAYSNASFEEKILAIEALAADRHEKLLLRNWAHVDFFSSPHVERPSGQLRTTQSLMAHFEPLELVTVRHPMDQWLSWCNYAGAAKGVGFDFGAFVDASEQFRTQTKHLPFIRYEDFVLWPDEVLEKMCGHLDLDFDLIALERWPYYHQITGDDNDRSSGRWLIESRPRRTPSQALQDEADSNEVYQQLLRHYGYQ